MKRTFTLCLILFSGLSGAAIDLPWESDSHPDIMSPYFNRKFQSLPLSGKVKDKNKYWSGDYWALKKGNINFRWDARNKTGFNLNSPDKTKVKKLSIPELAELAPSEKYDLMLGRYDYPLRNEVNQIANPSAKAWEGICHGRSPASMNHNEPYPKLMMNPDGIEIPFGSTDIKALLSYYYAYVYQTQNTHQMGKRCFKGPFLNREKDCKEDLNAGAFHIVLGNRLGLDQKGFIADIQRYEEVWNHPITAYHSVVLNEQDPDENSASGTVRKIEIKTEITYVDQGMNDWQTVIGTKKQKFGKAIYQYHLDVASDGTILGGVWISKNRPDFLWIMARPRQFTGILSRLGELLND